MSSTKRVQLGQHPAPRYTIAHVSDTHLLAGQRKLYGSVDQESVLTLALEQLAGWGETIDAVVVTGDLADLGEADAYRRLREIVEPAVTALDSTLVWVMGNHDEREPFRQHLLDQPVSSEPYDVVHTIGGLRIIALDTTVPGYHHGALDARQLDWLREQLADPADDGTLIALHHPPIPSPVELMAVLELDDQPALADVVRGTDVIGILGGHLHYTTHSTFAGVPVHVAAATCYSLDPLAALGTLRGVDGGQSFGIVQVYGDRIVHTEIPIGEPPMVSGVPDSVIDMVAAMSPHERREAFSNKRSTVNLAEEEASGGRQPDPS